MKPTTLGARYALTMTILQRVQRMLSEFRAAEPAIVLRTATLEPAVGPIDEEYEAELLEECPTFPIDPMVRTFWSEIETVDLSWGVRADGTGPGGRLHFPPLLRLVRPAFPDEDSVDQMGPRTDAERALLRDLHMLDLRDGGNWTALRARPDAPLELWFRHDCLGLRGGDVRLHAGLDRYVETALASRGANGWPLLLLDPARTPRELHAEIAATGLTQLLESLGALASVPAAAADAHALAEQAETMRRALR